jgi:hypothetical protein
MSEFLRHLAARSLGLEPVVRPRLSPMFAPPAPEREGMRDDFALAPAPDELFADLETPADEGAKVHDKLARDEVHGEVSFAATDTQIAHDSAASPSMNAPVRPLSQTIGRDAPFDTPGAMDIESVQPHDAVRHIASSPPSAPVTDTTGDVLRLPPARASQRPVAVQPVASGDSPLPVMQRALAAIGETPASTKASHAHPREAFSEPASPLLPAVRPASPDAAAPTPMSLPQSADIARMTLPPQPQSETVPREASSERDERRTLAESAAPAANAGPAFMPHTWSGASPLRDRRSPTNGLSARDQPEPTIHVSIGRVEIRATPAPAAASTQAARDGRAPTRLETYLRQRAGGSDT